MCCSILFLLFTSFVMFECSIPYNVYQTWKWISNPFITIVYGTPVLKGEYPSMVSIQEFGFHICGGNIINEYTILTAAHCTINSETSAWEAVAGVTDLNSGLNADAQIRKISKVIVHPMFEKHSSLFDIAVAQVEGGFIYTPTVSSINLHMKTFIPKKGVIIGWGATKEGGPHSNILLKTVIIINTKQQCLEDFGEEIIFGLICAKTDRGDACNGDSGGPLICNAKELCGIISSGQGCGLENESALYTDVTSSIG